MEMEDWTYTLAIALSAVVWVTIFVDYRKKLMRVMPARRRLPHQPHGYMYQDFIGFRCAMNSE